MKPGMYGEDLACAFLVQQGLTVVGRNVRIHRGEIDLIMRDRDILVFVEVKYRNSLTFGSPLEAVDFRKQAQLRRLAQAYLGKHRLVCPCRFDVVGIMGTDITWLKGAF